MNPKRTVGTVRERCENTSVISLFNAEHSTWGNEPKSVPFTPFNDSDVHELTNKIQETGYKTQDTTLVQIQE